jgi:4-hydroxy-2-oxoglutarate aldolase
MKKELKGIFTPVVTVFNEDETIDLQRTKENIRFYNTTPLTGYMPLGSNGEFQGLEDREALEVLEAVVSERSEEKVIVGGCGRESVPKTLSFIRAAAAVGLDYAFILAPHYFSASQSEEGLFRFFSRVADSSPIPVVIYNAPKFCGGMTLNPELVRRLSHHGNIAGIKNSSSAPGGPYLEGSSKDFCLLGGNVGNLLSSLEAGASGGVISTACYLPFECCRLFDLFRAGYLEEAKTLSDHLQVLSKGAAGPWAVPGVKACMELRGLHGGHVRLPLMDLPLEQCRVIADFLAQQGLDPFEY